MLRFAPAFICHVSTQAASTLYNMSRHVLPFGEGKLFSQTFPTGVAGRESEAWTAESIFSQSRVGELGADFLVTSCCLSRTASSCLRSVDFKKKKLQICVLVITHTHPSIHSIYSQDTPIFFP